MSRCPKCQNGNTTEHESPYVVDGTRLCRACLYTYHATPDPEECAMMRERSVAGLSDTIPPCTVCGSDATIRYGDPGDEWSCTVCDARGADLLTDK